MQCSFVSQTGHPILLIETKDGDDRVDDRDVEEYVGLEDDWRSFDDRDCDWLEVVDSDCDWRDVAACAVEECAEREDDWCGLEDRDADWRGFGDCNTGEYVGRMVDLCDNEGEV
ncbi:hypothetical protein K0M31_002289 [Melipona bicolor]|uniref:Uncharacterized protein n=1 Tax=Melipona bicolor TaxID=60889 RepID=A0AA40KYJ0_9HYME|nr:hypothetical protein K0M31_002289 [Melipona bicolor]